MKIEDALIEVKKYALLIDFFKWLSAFEELKYSKEAIEYHVKQYLNYHHE